MTKIIGNNGVSAEIINPQNLNKVTEPTGLSLPCIGQDGKYHVVDLDAYKTGVAKEAEQRAKESVQGVTTTLNDDGSVEFNFD